MSKLSAVEVSNFKCFRHAHVEIGGLTLLAGLNGMGKSTVIQAALLLRQSFSDLFKTRLQLSGSLIDLGTGADVFFDLADEDEITINVEYEVDLAGPWVRVEYVFAYDRSAESLRLKRVPANRAGRPGRYSLKYRQDGQWVDPADRTSGASTNTNMGRNPILRPTGFQYLSAERLGPRKMLPFSDERIFRRDLGSQGEYVLNFLSEWGSDVLDDADPRIVDKFSKRTVIAQVVDWLQDTSPGSRLDIRKLGDVDALTARYSYDRKGDVPSRPFRPTNVGFGLSYVLPVITALISARAGDLVVIENPEAHVHPRGQTKLGQLACRAVAAGVQVIVETHSDHFLDGVRIDVRDKVLSNTDVALHYFSRHGAEAMVHGPVLQSDGRLSDWPEGFFDQHATNMSRLLAPPAR